MTNNSIVVFLDSLQGECEVNPKYMKMKCGPACQSCDYLDIRNRCKIEDNGPNAWSPGDLDETFRRLSTEEPFVSQYNVQVLSSPNMNDGPWVVTLENVVSQEEADKLIQLGRDRGYERSTNVGKSKPDGTFESVVGAD
jgi:prolyl 4-hydroxylase